MPVPFIDLKRFEPGFTDLWLEKVRALSLAGRFIGGPEVEQLEAKLRQDCETSCSVTCANGTDALQIALRAVGVEQGDVILLPDFTFWATFEAVVNVGAEPVVVDVNPDDLQMDFDSFCKALELYKPRAAIIAHLYGWGSARLQDFRERAAERGIALIEDGAQSYGVRYNQESIYHSAQIATISFYPSKVFGAAGDGGAIVTSNRKYADQARQLANHGRSDSYSHALCGWNSRLDSLQAAYLNLGGSYLPKRLQSRQQSASYYRRAFSDLAQMGQLSLPPPPPGFEENGYLNLLLLPPTRRDELIKALQKKEIGWGIIYPLSISEQAGAYKYLKRRVGGENVKNIIHRVLSLPLFPYMESEELEQVTEVVRKIMTS